MVTTALFKDFKVKVRPTLFGWFFLGLWVLAILLAATTDNSALYILSFSVGALLFIAMIQTHNNLLGVSLKSISIQPQFAGQPTQATITVENQSSWDNVSVTLTRPKNREDDFFGKLEILPAHNHITINCYFTPKKRGHYLIDNLDLTSYYPVGLFKSSKSLNADVEYFVYPQPKGQAEFFSQPQMSFQQVAGLGSSAGLEDFSGHRQYLPGESQQHLDWKVVARGRAPMVKEFREGSSNQVAFDWNSLSHLDLEARLSQLALWIQEAMKKNILYSLNMPQGHVPRGHGGGHHQKCLKLLATHGEL